MLIKKTVQILIIWLQKKSSDLDQHCFKKKLDNFEKLKHTACLLDKKMYIQSSKAHVIILCLNYINFGILLINHLLHDSTF